MERILITGGSGFIGTNLVERCVGAGHDVISLDIAPPRNPAHHGVWRLVDILERDVLAESVAAFDPDLVFHLAARTDLDGKAAADYAANFTGTSNLIDALSSLKRLKRVIFASSMLVCRLGYRPKDEWDYRPSTAYGESKIQMEAIIRTSTHIPCSWVIVRPTSIWGPWFGPPYKNFFRAVAKGYYFHPGTKAVRRSFGYVGNVVYQLDKLMQARAGDVHSRTYYLSDYDVVVIRDLANLVQRTVGVREIKTVPISILKAAARAGDVAKKAGWRNPPLTTFRLNNLTTTAVYDVQPLKEIVGPLPHSLEDGVRETVAWLRQQSQEKYLLQSA